MTQEFHLRITALGEDEVFARVEQGSMGTPLAEERYHWPIAEWFTTVQDMVQTPFDPQRSMDPTTLGQSLYRSLFQGSLKQSWDIAQGIAQNRSQILRLRLGVKDLADQPYRLQQLPWEILHDGHRPLATAQSVIFSRYQPNFSSLNHVSLHPGASQETSQTLRILMVVAAPEDQAQLALKQEARLLQQELEGNGNRAQFPIELEILEQPGREQLTQVLEQGQYHIFHFSGHSSPGFLHLVNRHTGLTERLPGEDLAGLLRNNRVSLALLNSCRGHWNQPHGVVNVPEFQPSLADVLVRSGLPAVLTMAEQIPDRVALTLTRLFYRNLKLGYPIDLSLCRARQGLLSSYGAQYFYWCLPVLYLRSDFDGQFLNSRDRISPVVEQEWLFRPAVDASALAFDTVRSSLSPQENGFLANGYPAMPNPPQEPSPLLPAAPVSPDLDFNPASESTLDLDPELSLNSLPLPSDPEAQRWFDQLSTVSAIEEEEELVPLGDERLLPEGTPPSLYPDLPPAPLGRWIGGTIAPVSPGAETALVTVTPDSIADLPFLETRSGESTTIAIYRQTLALNPTDARTYHKLGLSLVEAGQLEEGIEAFHQALTFNGSDPEIYRSLGEALCRQGHYQNAILAYRQAIALNPNLTEVYRLLAVTLAKQGQAAFFPQRIPPADPPPAFSSKDSEITTVLDVSPEPLSINRPLGLPLWVWLGTTGCAAIVTLSVVFSGTWQLFHPMIPFTTSSTAPKPATEPEFQVDHSGLVANAVAALKANQTAQAAETLRSLLDQGDLPAVQRILKTVTPKALEDPELNFLYGRFLWQTHKAGDPAAKLEEARLYWQTAQQQQPRSSQYLNALAFAHYQEGDWGGAKTLWLQVLPLEGEPQNPLFANGNPLGGRYPDSTAIPTSEALTASAGLALVLWHLGTLQPVGQQSQFSNQALQLYDRVMKNSPDFTPDRLAQNWLWTTNAIQEWQAIGQAHALAPQSP